MLQFSHIECEAISQKVVIEDYSSQKHSCIQYQNSPKTEIQVIV